MRSLSLKAYKALSRNASDAGQQTRPSRPPGVLIWIMVHHEEELRAALYLHDRLVQTHGPSSLLLTLLWDTPLTEPQGVLCERLASDQTQYAQGFLDHWQPDICIWMSGNLKPSLIAEARSRKIPLFLLGAESESLERSTGRWVPGLTRDTLGAFDLITAASPEAERMMRKALPRSGDIQLSAPLQIASPAPPVAQDRFQDLSDMISGRSVWLAARVQESELSDVLEAHKTSVRLTHRLLLVLVCASFPVAMTARKKLARDNWRCCFWDDGDVIDEATQVVLVEDPDDMGLWLRAAPVTFLASSLRAGYGGCDPYEAAALGSAIIYGPNVRAHLGSYSRLAAAGAARIIADAPSLARALSHLLAVDQAASMAHAAWQVVSSGAQATDRVVEQVQELLDASARMGTP